MVGSFSKENIFIMRKIFRTFWISALLLYGIETQAFTLSELLDQSPTLKAWTGFQGDQGFHCSNKESYVTINNKTYEISLIRVLGLKGSTTYKDFNDLVTTLKLDALESEPKTLYKEFPEMKFELLNVKLEDPKIQILISLRNVE